MMVPMSEPNNQAIECAPVYSANRWFASAAPSASKVLPRLDRCPWSLPC